LDGIAGTVSGSGFSATKSQTVFVAPVDGSVVVTDGNCLNPGPHCLPHAQTGLVSFP